MGPGLIIGIVAGVIVLIIVWYIVTMNNLRATELKVEEAESGIDVALTKRYDVLTKQLAVTKEYASYESKTIFETIRIRQGMNMSERKDAINKMDKVAKDLNVTLEAYPQLKASENFAVLQRSITDVEEHLQAARRAYNSNATIFNTAIVMFPASIVAGMLGMHKRELFEAEAHKRQDVEMKF